jgi:hypothetical protein
VARIRILPSFGDAAVVMRCPLPEGTICSAVAIRCAKAAVTTKPTKLYRYWKIFFPVIVFFVVK